MGNKTTYSHLLISVRMRRLIKSGFIYMGGGEGRTEAQGNKADFSCIPVHSLDIGKYITCSKQFFLIC